MEKLLEKMFNREHVGYEVKLTDEERVRILMEIQDGLLWNKVLNPYLEARFLKDTKNLLMNGVKLQNEEKNAAIESSLLAYDIKSVIRKREQDGLVARDRLAKKGRP